MIDCDTAEVLVGDDTDGEDQVRFYVKWNTFKLFIILGYRKRCVYFEMETRKVLDIEQETLSEVL